MEKHYNEELLIQKLIQEAGLEKPSEKFASNVLQAIADRKAVTAYKPLISKKALIAIYGLGVFSVIALYYLNAGVALDLDLDLSFIKSWSFPRIELSGLMTFGIAMITLFLIEIPFLKDFLEKQYRLASWKEEGN